MLPRVITRQKKGKKSHNKTYLVLLSQYPGHPMGPKLLHLRTAVTIACADPFMTFNSMTFFFFFFANHGFIATHLISDAVLERQERCSSRIDILPFLNTSTHQYNPLAPICESKQVCSILLQISRVITPANHKHMMMLAAPLLYKQINLHECYKYFLSN